MSLMLAAAAGVRFALVDDELVYLDLRTDQYGMIQGVGDKVVLHASDLMTASDERLVEVLSTAGLVCDKAPTKVSPLRIGAVDLRDQTADRLTAADALRFAAVQLDVLTSFHRRPLGALVEQVARRKQIGIIDNDAACAAALRFRALLPLAPVAGLCLQQSFMLLAWLHRQGLGASWVFGVRTWPFEAHCWVQAGPILLNDTTERVATFEPILWV
ncbi:lasso peptide biosynthesis B2 protein [Caulobacter segnis]|uniref:lasso peptide biosynthesis B2 protein n=1 Tax=Caulobacter segnis TaxID=88688 RepID=UPI00241099DC|nr:lasso peptide biosynthesis B2 protein [Caulobacter segnis]MDG2520526.1 lasso peptide biosynthesis B2 protein [Caulobacter segnis]